jgi:hypothetical protein
LINALLVEFLLEDEREGPVRKSPPDKDDLIRVLEAIQRKWGDSFRSGERIWLYVDALDEADSAEFSYANLLPTASDLDRLPDPVRMVVSSRHDPAFADLERHERCLLVDLDLADEQTARQTIDEAAEFARRLLAATGLETAPIPHDLAAALLGNFQLVKIVCSDWRDRSPSSAEAESEIKLLASIDAGEVGGHAAFHRIYRKYFWNRIERKCGPDRVDEATRIAGYLAVGRGAVPKDMLRQYDATLAHVEGLLTILRPFLRRRRVWSPHDSDRPWLEAYSFDHETYRSFVIDSKDTDPAVSNIVADELREKIAACYQPKSALEWDHFGLRSCARLHLDRHSPAEAVALIKRPDFLLAVINAHEEDSEGERRTAEGLGVDSLRAMVQQVQQAIN